VSRTERRAGIVNAITFARVPLIFAWLALAVLQEVACGFWLGFWACAAMLFSGLTDAFDGALARRWDVVSTLGKMADPLMDKVFYVVAFPALTWLVGHQGESAVHAFVMLCFTISYILRDFWVTFLRTVGSLYGADVGAMWLGKVRTALSFPAAGWVYLYLIAHGSVPACWQSRWLASCYAIEGAMIALTTYSCVTYTLAYAPYLKKALARK
jgi:CDP-diacylglycerol--glycerol-3-phosphate 3-phosphatidyltransferase